jgi:hypothetical protein
MEMEWLIPLSLPLKNKVMKKRTTKYLFKKFGVTVVIWNKEYRPLRETQNK